MSEKEKMQTEELARMFPECVRGEPKHDTPRLTGLVDTKSRYAGNTVMKKNFPGGHITIVGANSPSSLASRPIKMLLADEIDRYPKSAGTEGDPSIWQRNDRRPFGTTRRSWPALQPSRATAVLKMPTCFLRKRNGTCRARSAGHTSRSSGRTSSSTRTILTRV